MDDHCTRRQFASTAAAASAALILASPHRAADPDKGVKWPIGCFNRPWSAWSYDEALVGMKAAGFDRTGILGDHAGETFILPVATKSYLDALRDRIKKSGLTVEVAWLRTRHDVALDEAARHARQQVDNAHLLGVKYLLTTGVDQRETYEHFYRVMADVSAYAADRKMQIVLKPHGGCSATAEEMLRTIKQVNHANFRIWYDAGNIVHYTDADPVADVARIAAHVAGFSAKDCARRGGDVMLQFGEGKVDFHGVFSVLKKANFLGPVLVECCRGRSKTDLIDNARHNRQYLERLLASL